MSIITNFLGVGWWGWITGLFFLVLIIWIVAAFVNKRNSHVDNEDPLIILKRRYAKGEMSKEEYEEARKNLSK